MGLPQVGAWIGYTQPPGVATPTTLSSRRVLGWGGRCSLRRAYNKCVPGTVPTAHVPPNPCVLSGRE